MKVFIRSCTLVSIIGLTALLQFRAFGQENLSSTRGYVKMEIGAMGLHCPFLGGALKSKLAADTGYSEIQIDKSEKFLIFAYEKAPEYTAEFFKDVAVKIGYPPEIVMITLTDIRPPVELEGE